MPAGDETPTSAATILQQRLAALRSSNSSSSSSVPSGTSSTIKTAEGLAKNDDDDEDENLSQLLASLDVPDDTGDDDSDDDTDLLNDSGIDVPIQVKNVDEQVTHYLTTASQLPSTASLPPLSSSTSQRKLEATLGSYENLAPKFVAPIEVSFFTPPSTNLSGPSGGIRGDEEEEALMARLRDELSVEKAVQSREGNVEDGWERRLSKMKEFRPITDPEKEREYLERAKGLGEGPGLEGVEELQRRKSREKKGRRKGGSGSEEDTDSEEDTESESDEE
ncbi:BZ3500_MvSof-1268-A1-R1_Chr3-2g06313 [Microbotryum saponariae]|uniref:BZ3500_MvSof-1268-A1-R1_Chr3-2g06313 protein n=1 Tax=Microbotryum saponariae TaxID=289078 RepID=A0A2X0KVV2_9BASI|nr:BZ3500_MvSof-1268-A1-R1_Chr3-2g06313 [Microbotryum saponariae]SDA04284.1 BZ3501_MvSof-1269-A2-R1_Chr3-2g06004 [Microbotryum saponariae]